MAAVAASLLVFVAGCAQRVVPTTRPALGVGTTPPPATCPATLVQPYHFPAASRLSMVPGSPDGATVCRYAGLNEPHPQHLVTSEPIGPGPAAGLAGDLNRAKAFPTGTPVNCPNDVAADDLIRFGFPDGHRVDVVLDLTGCRTADNGQRQVFVPAEVSGRLAALVGR
jgi:hypothetical protein